jgi:hypothetical protein
MATEKVCHSCNCESIPPQAEGEAISTFIVKNYDIAFKGKGEVTPILSG